MKNENNLYKLLNETKTDFSEYDDVHVSGIEKQHLIDQVLKHKQTARKNRRKVLILAASVFVLFLSSQTTWGQSVQAVAKSFLENIQYSIAQVFGVNDETPPDSVLSIGQTAHIGEAEVKIEDLLAFDDHLLLNVLLDLDTPITEQRAIGVRDIVIHLNGTLLYQGSPSFSGKVIDETNNISHRLLRIPLQKDFILPDVISLEVQLNDIHIIRPGQTTTTPQYITGTADFSVETTAEELTKYTHFYTLDQEIMVEELRYHVSQLSLHPIVSYLTLHSPDKDQEYQVMEFRGFNEAGKQVVFEPFGYQTTDSEWIGKMKFSEEDSEITTQELYDSEWIELQLYSAGHPIGEAVHRSYGEAFQIQMK